MSENKKEKVAFISDNAVLIIAILIIFILFQGEPDLHDAIIQKLMGGKTE